MSETADQDIISINAEFPKKLKFLFEAHRYKVAYGGRGGAKSWAFARAILIKGTQRKLKVLCCREIQSSIAESVHALLSEQIDVLGFSDRYKVQKNIIIGRNGTEILFEGLRYNTPKIKSFEGADIAWVEEAHSVTKSSWEILIPTIRKENSEIWVSFNPEEEDDETYKRFVLNPSSSAIVMKINWRDNPWFPEVLRKEKDELYLRDPDAHLHVWEGHCQQSVEGAVYAKELRDARLNERITKVPYHSDILVDTFWDLGHADLTAIWFIQKDAPGTFRVIDFYHNQFQKIGHYIKVLQQKEYVYGTDYIPHDGANETLAAKSIENIMRNDYNRKVVVVSKMPVILGLNAVRTVFPLCYFDADKCSDGLMFLRKYKYAVNPTTGNYGKAPAHDNNSHGADAFKTFALGYQGYYNETLTDKGNRDKIQQYDPRKRFQNSGRR